MRRHDIVIDYTPVDVQSEGLYLPKKKTVQVMTLAELVRGMCPKSGHDLSVCRDHCKAPCRYGNELLRRCNNDE